MFFVHNRVKTIEKKAWEIQKLVNGAKVTIAHGQMAKSELEKAMIDFVMGDTDVLVCTTIIESGLDIASANTIIVNRADRFGLAQMYQLRGRVGRADEQAYAYLLIPHESLLSKDAQKRLKVEVVGIISVPDPTGTSEVGNTGLGADPGTGENSDSRGVEDKLRQFLDFGLHVTPVWERKTYTKFRISNVEIQNKFKILNPNVQNIQIYRISSSFGHSGLFRISCFVFRICLYTSIVFVYSMPIMPF